MNTNGRLVSGICSTRSREYENRPSTVMPIITIVAKTGLLMLVRVIHMVFVSLGSPRAAALQRSLDGACRLGRRGVLRGSRRLDQRRRAILQVVELRREHGDRRSQRRLDLDPPGRFVA